MKGVVILGPTASGKSDLAMRLASEAGGEIVSVDSRQVYRRLDIGTAKPTLEDRRRIPHHLIDAIEITGATDAEWFAAKAGKSIDDIVSRGRLPVLAGGSGLYLRAVLEGFFRIDLAEEDRRRFEETVRGLTGEELHDRLVEVDGESAARIHPNDRYRTVRALEIAALTGRPMSVHIREQAGNRSEDGWIKLGLAVERAELRKRIGERAVWMYEAGWPDEVDSILRDGFDPLCPGLRTLGYDEMVRHVRGLAGKDETLSSIVTRTRQYAKRQVTWFRKERGVAWLEPSRDTLEKALKLLDTGEGNW